MNESRSYKSLLNAQVGLLFYFLTLALSFISRKIFLDNLGAEFIGLTGTLINILGFLNLAEFGIGSAISFFLYKPLQNADRTRISELISLFGYVYRKIGLAIGLGGIVVSLFFPLIFKETPLGMGIIYFVFYCYLGSSLIGYFINYRQVLLTADQKNYIVTAYFQTANIIKTLIQIALAWYFKNLFVWVSIEFLFSLLSCLILNWKIDKEYPWLHTTLAEGKQLLRKNPDLFTYTKQIFIHKIKDFLLNRSDEIMIFAFVSLKMVAYYGNYTLIITKINQIIATGLDSVSAGVGLLIAEGEPSKIMKVFWELSAIRYFIAGVVVFGLYHLLCPFIILWLGPEYLLGQTVLILLLITVFIMQTRGVVDIFNHAHGLYADVWTAWTEGIVNLSVTITTASFWGIAGVLTGKIASILPIIVFWKPYYLFSAGFKLPVGIYWKQTIRYYLLFAGCFILFSLLARWVPFRPEKSFLQLIGYASLTVVPFTVCYFLLLLSCAAGMKDFLGRFAGLVRKIKHKIGR